MIYVEQFHAPTHDADFQALRNESALHNDIVFRGDWCGFYHLRHPEKINYGNVFQRPWTYGGAGVPYYQLRGLYKVCRAI